MAQTQTKKLVTKAVSVDTTSKVLPRITDVRRETIMNALLDWHIETAKSKDTSDYHNTIARLARRTKLNHQQVAGIAANLKRGTYGELTNLMRARKAAIRRASAK